jgi:hypothetical protein
MPLEKNGNIIGEIKNSIRVTVAIFKTSIDPTIFDHRVLLDFFLLALLMTLQCQSLEYFCSSAQAHYSSLDYAVLPNIK